MFNRRLGVGAWLTPMARPQLTEQRQRQLVPILSSRGVPLLAIRAAKDGGSVSRKGWWLVTHA